MKYVGIDIGTNSIKVAELEATSKSYILTGYLEFPLSQDPQKDRNLEMIEVLRKVSASYDSSSTKYVVAISQDKVSVHFKQFPFRERQKIQKSLAFELEDDIPLDPDDTVFDAKILEYVENHTNVLAIATPKDSVAEILQLCRDGAFEPDIISVEGLALANLFENWYQAPPAIPSAMAARSIYAGEDPDETKIQAMTTPARTAQAVLYLGHTHTLLLVYRDGCLLSVRSIYWGGLDVARTIAKTFNTPLTEAVRVLQTRGAILMVAAGASRDQVFLSTAITSGLDQLARDVRLILLEIQTEFHVAVGGIELMGGLSQVQNLAPYLTQSLEISANVGRPLSGLKQTRIEVTPSMEATAATAIGLAFEALKRPRNPATNLRKEEFARQNLSLQKAWEKWRHATQVAAVAFVALCLYTFIRDVLASGLVTKASDSLTTQAKNLAKSNPALKPTESGVKAYIKEQRELFKSHQVLAKLDRFNSAAEILARLSDRMPTKDSNGQKIELNVKKLLIDNDDFQIEGSVANPAHLTEVQRTLEQFSKGKSLQKINPTIVAQGTVFAFSMKLSRDN